MVWPISQDYNEAIQNPRSSFADAELRDGQVTVNSIGLPLPRSGNFADVYEFNCPATKGRWAIKCFTRKVAGLGERYSEVNRHLAAAGVRGGVCGVGPAAVVVGAAAGQRRGGGGRGLTPFEIVEGSRRRFRRSPRVGAARRGRGTATRNTPSRLPSGEKGGGRALPSLVGGPGSR